jgi:hypothetical protein
MAQPKVIIRRAPEYDLLAHHVVCAHIFPLDPKNIRHLALAAECGYGSLDLEDIEITDGCVCLFFSWWRRLLKGRL